MKNISQKDIVFIVKRGGIGVLPTDTLYGIVGSALSKKAVERIYQVRKRDPKKPLIILINSLSDLGLFNILLSAREKKVLRMVWPGAVSVMLPCPRKRFIYLHRGTDIIAFRVPADAKLRVLLKKTGPLAAPSANIEGAPPARTVAMAKKYFDDAVDFYVDGGRREGKPSTLVSLEDGMFVVKRKGAVKIK